MSATAGWRPTGVHLVGSVPLAGTEEVMRAVANVLPGHVRRITDGETGQLRKNWVACQFPILAGIPQLEQGKPDPSDYAAIVAFRLRADADPGDIEMPRLGYAGWARASFDEFRWLKDQEIIPEHWRFQVSLPAPLGTIVVFVDQESRAALEPLYTAALMAELDDLLGSIPHEELTIQWDVCQETGLWEGFYPPHWEGDVKQHLTAELSGLGEAVPEGVELGFHLCYGDYDHEHFMQPKDAGALAEIANAISRATTRRIDYLHLPVPRDRDDEDYFRPLAGLELGDTTKLYLGLVHATDGAEGTRRRIETAREFVEDFGIATECGFGRRPPIQVGDLLQLHREVAAPEVSAEVQVGGGGR